MDDHLRLAQAELKLSPGLPTEVEARLVKMIKCSPGYARRLVTAAEIIAHRESNTYFNITTCCCVWCQRL